jgi:HprK-related kinase B
MSVAAPVDGAFAHELRLRLADVALRVLCDDSEVWRRLRLYYDPWVVTDEIVPYTTVRLARGMVEPVGRFVDVPRADGRPVKEAVREAGGIRLIWKRRTGVVMGLARGEAYAIGDLRTHVNQAINLVNNCYAKAMLERGHSLLHASAVSWNGRAAALAGPAGAGKSTSALHLVEAGFRFVTNDRLLARPASGSVEALGYPKWPRVNPGTLMGHPRLRGLLTPADHAALARLRPDELWHLERKADVDLDRIYGRGTIGLCADLRAILLLRWRRGSGGLATRRLTSAQALEAVPLVHKDLGVFDLDRAPGAARDDWDRGRYRALLEGVTVVEVTGGIDFGALVPIVAGLLGAADPRPG